jgi:mono/diheme cytochrome c family protein
VPVATLTALGKTVLLIVAITFILWSLYTAMVIPKKRPGFPKRLDAFVLVSAVLFVAQMSAVVWVTGTQEVEKEETAAEEPGSTTEEPTPTTEEPPPTTEEPTAPTGNAEEGAAVFESAGCGGCHALADAGAAGQVGPNLDATKPSYELVLDRVTNGQGGMPSFADQLTEQQIADVSAYVSSVAGVT